MSNWSWSESLRFKTNIENTTKWCSQLCDMLAVTSDNFLIQIRKLLMFLA